MATFTNSNGTWTHDSDKITRFSPVPSEVNIEVPADDGLGQTFTTVGCGAFAGCHGIETITMAASITTIEFGAFQLCRSLSAVTVGANVTSIGNAAFYYCQSLIGIDVHANNPNYANNSGDRVLYDKAIATLMKKPNALIAAYSIPATVTAIAPFAFDFSTKTTMDIPNTVLSIGNDAFIYNNELASVNIGTGLNTIGQAAFLWCPSLASISFSGLTAPTSVGENWILGTNASLLGHAKDASDFTQPPGVWNGLTMGIHVAP